MTERVADDRLGPLLPKQAQGTEKEGYKSPRPEVQEVNACGLRLKFGQQIVWLLRQEGDRALSSELPLLLPQEVERQPRAAFRTGRENNVQDARLACHQD